MNQCATLVINANQDINFNNYVFGISQPNGSTPYYWGGESAVIGGVNRWVFKGLVSGDYKWYAKDMNGIIVMTGTQTVDCSESDLESAIQSAYEAEQSAIASANSATEASESATTATTKATEAEQSAMSAQSSAEQSLSILENIGNIVDGRLQVVSAKASVTMPFGTPVYVIPAGNSSSNALVAPASASSEATSSKTLGFTIQPLNANGLGDVCTGGELVGFNTSTATQGDPVYLGATAGTYVFGLANKPVPPLHAVYLGVVTHVHATQGKILVNVQNGFEMNEIHDYLEVNKQDGDVIQYDVNSGLYKNKSLTISSKSKIGQFFKKKTVRVLGVGTSIFNNDNSGIKSFVSAMYSQFGDSGNTTYRMGEYGGTYELPQSGWNKQRFSGFGLVRMRGDSSSSPLTLPVSYCKQIIIRYSIDTNGSTCNVLVDGVQNSTLNCSGTQKYGNELIINVTEGLHTLTIQPPASGYIYLESVDFNLNNVGLHFLDATLGGSSMNNLVNTDIVNKQPLQVQAVSAIGYNGVDSLFDSKFVNEYPDLIICSYTVNDAGLGTSNFTTFKNAIDRIVQKTFVNGVELLYVIEMSGHYCLPSDPNYNDYNNIRNYLKSLKSPNLTVVDWNDLVGMNSVNLDVLLNRSYLYYNVTNINTSNASYSGDYIHPNDKGNAIIAQALCELYNIDPIGQQGSSFWDIRRLINATKFPYSRATILSDKSYISSFVEIEQKNNIGLYNSYVASSSCVSFSTIQRPLWVSKTELNLVDTINDLVLASQLSDSKGKYIAPQPANPIGFYTPQFAGNSQTGLRYSIIIIADGNVSIAVRNGGNTSYRELFDADMVTTPTQTLQLQGSVDTNCFHVGINTNTDSSYVVLSGAKIRGLYVTLTDFPCLPLKKESERKMIIPLGIMVGDLELENVTNNQLYYENINGKSVEKIAIGAVYKPIQNKHFALYRSIDRSNIQKMVFPGTVTTGAYNKKYGSFSVLTTDTNGFVNSPTLTSSSASKTYTLAGVLKGLTDFVKINIYFGGTNTWYSLKSDGTWQNNGGSAYAGENLAKSTYSGTCAFTFTLPDSSIVNSNFSIRLNISSANNSFDWTLAEGSSAMC